jgi:hypothetical protein
LAAEWVTVEIRVKILVNTVNDPKCSIDKRCEAAELLGVLKSRSAVPGLVAAMKANRGDVLMLSIIGALKNIGDARALPALRYMEAREDIEFYGSINAALDRAIYCLDKKANRGKTSEK